MQNASMSLSCYPSSLVFVLAQEAEGYHKKLPSQTCCSPIIHQFSCPTSRTVTSSHSVLHFAESMKLNLLQHLLPCFHCSISPSPFFSIFHFSQYSSNLFYLDNLFIFNRIPVLSHASHRAEY